MSGEMDIGLGLSSSLDREPSASWKVVGVCTTETDSESTSVEKGEPTSACSDGESVVCSGKEQVANEAVDAEAKWENVSSATASSMGVVMWSDVVPSDIDILLSSFKGMLVSNSCLTGADAWAVT